MQSAVEHADQANHAGVARRNFVMKCGGSTLAALPDSFLKIWRVCSRKVFNLSLYMAVLCDLRQLGEAGDRNRVHSWITQNDRTRAGCRGDGTGG